MATQTAYQVYRDCMGPIGGSLYLGQETDCLNKALAIDANFDPNSPMPTASIPPPPKQKSRWWIWAIVIILVIALAVLAYFYFS